MTQPTAMPPPPGKTHYRREYFGGGRVFSYAHQIETVRSHGADRVLEIGVGAGVVAGALPAMGMRVTTSDVQPDLNPDDVASVTNLPFDTGEFDVAVCCQVVEHLPFSQPVPALRELRRVATIGAVVSLPDVTRRGFVAAELPKIPAFAVRWTVPRWIQPVMPGSQLESVGHPGRSGTGASRPPPCGGA